MAKDKATLSLRFPRTRGDRPSSLRCRSLGARRESRALASTPLTKKRVELRLRPAGSDLAPHLSEIRRSPLALQ